MQRLYGGRVPFLERGIGDDAAVLRPRGAAERWVVTTDQLLEEVDFRREWGTPAQLGHRALAVNLSDVAAMGARPRFYTVALGLPPSLPASWISRFYRGLTRLGRRYGAALIGGDLSRSPAGIHISLTVLGETVDKRIVFRSGGRSGDVLYVTGVLGIAAAGLDLLLAGKRPSSAAERRAVAAHLRPEPRCEVGMWLAASGLARAMMDCSDGLSVDLPRLARASTVGAEIWGSALPCFDAARSWGKNPVELALHGGEDYELLFAVASSRAAELERRWPAQFPALSRIGRLTGRAGVRIAETPGARPSRLPPRGFDHFAR